MGGWPVRSARARPPAPPAPLEGEGTVSGPWLHCPGGEGGHRVSLRGCLRGQCARRGPGAVRRPVCPQQRDPEGSEGVGGSCRRRVGRPAAAQAPRGSGRRRWASPEGASGGGRWAGRLAPGGGPVSRGCGRCCSAGGSCRPAGARGFWTKGTSPILSNPQRLPVQAEGRAHCLTRKMKVHLVKALAFPEVIYGQESWAINKAEHQRTDAFELWCWRRLLRVPWTARRSNQSILKEINLEYSLEGLMRKLKLCYFGHLM